MRASEDSVKKAKLSENVRVSVVIPHFYGKREENFRGLLEDLKNQTFQEMEIITVHGVAPQGRAINQGVRAAKGRFLVIMDDDARMGNHHVIENLIHVLERDSSVGMAGASVVIPPTANSFQQSTSKQFPRYNMAVVREVTESDLPGHPCCAFPMEVFVKAGMETEDILRGLDPDLRVRIRKAGYRVVLAPDTWIYHPLPETWSQFVRVFLRNGYGSAYLQMTHPGINYDTDESLTSGSFVEKHSFFYRILRYPVRLIQSLIAFQWFRFLGYTVYILGYVAGFIRFGLFKFVPAGLDKKQD